MNEQLKKLLDAEAPFLALTSDKKKIVCSMNNHELPVRLDAVESFVNGKKYKRLKGRKSTEDWADTYKPFLLPSVNFPNMMFCALTNHVIQKKKEVVEEHLKGRKFKKAQERFQNDKAELYEEPTIAEMEEAIANEQAEMEAACAEAESEDGSFEFEPTDDVDIVQKKNEHDAIVDANKRKPTGGRTKTPRAKKPKK